MNAKLNFLSSWACPVMVAITLTLGLNMASAAPVCDDNGGLSPYICVDKIGDDPELDFDFRRDFTDPANPDITLLTGNLGWKVWSQVSVSDATPANIGDIKIDATLPADVFEMSLMNATGGPGAANVGSIILSDATNWTGHSSITTGEITGDLAGDLTVVKDTSDNGGEVALTIDGKVSGNVTIPVVNGILQILGGFTGSLMHIDEVALGSGLTIGDGAAVNIDGDIEIGTVFGAVGINGGSVVSTIVGDVTIDLVVGGTMLIGGHIDPPSEVTIKQLTSGATVIFGENADETMNGTIRLPNGIPSSQFVALHNVFAGNVDFLGKDLAGSLFTDFGGAGHIKNIETLSGAFFVTGINPLFTGTVTMETLSGRIQTIGVDLDGVYVVHGDVTATGTFDARQDLLATIDIGGDMGGSITSVGDMSGQILVGGLIADTGDIDIGGALTGNICAANVPPGGPLPSNITLGSIAAGATLCTYAINCLVDGDCNDYEACTNDVCIDNFCWNPCNGGQGCDPCAPGTARPYLANKKNRYLLFDPGNTAVPVAFDVTLTDAVLFPAEPTPLFLGWVGQPAGNGVSPVVGQPYFSDSWDSVVQVGDCEIVPAATYDIRATTNQSPYTPFTTALQLETIDQPGGGKFWGDVVGTLDDAIYTPPNGTTNFIDVQATIKGFQSAPNAAHFTWLDVHPQCPNGVINFNDTFQVIKAFTGGPYPFVGPSDCVPCTGPATGSIEFLMVADNEVIDPGGQVVIDVFVEPASDVGAYEVSLEVLGGTTGSLDLTSMTVNKARGDYIFGTSSVADAVDENGARLAAAMSDGTGVDATTANDYLGTFTFTASSDASGVFEVKVRPVEEAFLSDSNVDGIGTSAGDSLFIGVDVECVNDGHCDDGSECTDDACVVFVCQNTNNYCDDANDCTSDTCNAGVCEHSNEPAGTPCEDGQFCTTPDTCNNKGVCLGGPNDPCLPTEFCIEFLDMCLPGS